MRRIGRTCLKASFALLIWLCLIYTWPVMFDTTQRATDLQSNKQEPTHHQLTHPQNQRLAVSGLAQYINHSSDQLVAQYGQPAIKSDQGNETSHWLYYPESRQAFEATINQLTNQVEQLVMLGNQSPISPFDYQQSLASITQTISLAANFEVRLHEQQFQIELTETQQKQLPLVEFKNQTYAILKMTDARLSQIIYLNANTLLQTNLYRVRSKTPTPVNDSDYSQVQASQQSITNLQQFSQIMRLNQQLPSLPVKPLQAQSNESVVLKSLFTKKGWQQFRRLQNQANGQYLTTRAFKLAVMGAEYGLSPQAQLFVWPNQVVLQQLTLSQQTALTTALRRTDLQAMRIGQLAGATILVLE